MAEMLLAGGALVVILWCTREPDLGAPLWTWAAWQLPDTTVSYVDLRTIRRSGDPLPIRRHDGTARVWPDQGTSVDVIDVPAIRRERDFTSWRRPVAVGAAGLAMAGATRPVPVVLGDGRAMWTAAGTGWPRVAEPPRIAFDFSPMNETELDRFKARFREAAKGPAIVLPAGADVQVLERVEAPALSDVEILDGIEASLSAGVSSVVSDALLKLWVAGMAPVPA